ncbi:MAG TPA: CoA pyrophosphatase [Candidatus Binatia bacterium]|jgi:8-oxo-dGTP pyrophosphatase MutT (NUDIX family)
MIDAALVIPVYRAKDRELHIVMILRQPGGVHGGQVAFPGGKHDPEDETMLDTALREAKEELGLLIGRGDILAELPVAETRTTGYRVFPYVARIQVPNRWQRAEREIAEILDVKLSDLLQTDGHAKMVENFPTWQEPQPVSFYQIGPHRLWGLSYRILHPIIPRLTAGEWDV